VSARLACSVSAAVSKPTTAVQPAATRQCNVMESPDADGSTETDTSAHVHARVCKVRPDVTEAAFDVLALQRQGSRGVRPLRNKCQLRFFDRKRTKDGTFAHISTVPGA
jgi:hypothetical protein